MYKNRFTPNSITAAGIAVVMLLLTVGTGATSSIILLNTAYAQSASPTLGEPFFVEKGINTAQGEIGPNRTQWTFTSNGTINGNIEVTDAGEFVSVSRGNNLILDKGQGVVMTKDGSEMANYTFIDVGNGTTFLGASAWNTNSTGELSFLNNALVIYKIEAGDSGNYSATEWLWK
jgi:hypothetical protein